MSNLYYQNLKSQPSSPCPLTTIERGSQYMEMLLEEKKKLAFCAQDFPICIKLLNEEIWRVYEMIPNLSDRDFSYFDRQQLRSPNLSNSLDFSPLQHHVNMFLLSFLMEDMTKLQGLPTRHSTSCLPIKKLLRVNVPVDKYPDFNFVGRLLGPRGHSLKRIEAATGCRFFIRGRGSMKDPAQEDLLRGRPGYGHLNEPLHILIESKSLPNLVDVSLRKAKQVIEELLIPANYAGDHYKKEQLRELAMLNSLYKEHTSHSQHSTSSGTMKRAPTARKGWTR